MSSSFRFKMMQCAESPGVLLRQTSQLIDLNSALQKKARSSSKVRSCLPPDKHRRATLLQRADLFLSIFGPEEATELGLQRGQCQPLAVA
jgi:hypothetical protein